MKEAEHNQPIPNFFGNQTLASAPAIGQRPNFTIAKYSALAYCENCSLGHCVGVGGSKLGRIWST